MTSSERQARRETLAVANLRSTQVRRDRMRVRDQLRARTVTVAEVLMDPPAAILELPVMDVLRMLHISRAARTLETINRRAVMDGVNLMITVGRASHATREWAGEHAYQRDLGGRTVIPTPIEEAA